MSKLIENLMNEYNAKSFIEENFQYKLDALKELREELINLMIRCFNTKSEQERDIKDFVILGVLLKYAITMLDSSIILLSEGATVASFLPARTLFEITIYIDWILKEDSLNRAKCYFVGDQRAHISKLKRMIKGTKENLSFAKFLNEVDMIIDPVQQALSEKEIQKIEKLLSSEEYKDINDKFEELKGKSKNETEPYWYKLTGCNSIKKMAKKLALSDDYEFFYSDLSSIVHPTDTYYQITVVNNQIHLENIRNPLHIVEATTYSIGYSLHILRKILGEYRPVEINNIWVFTLVGLILYIVP